MTTSRLNPYIHFKDTARSAMEFYKTVFGGELTLSTFGEGQGATGPEKDLIMHAQLINPAGYWLMASDTPPGMDFKSGSQADISLSGDDEKSLTDYWNKLSAGATIVMPLAKAPWGDSFGMLVDKFGIPWLVNISAAQS